MLCVIFLSTLYHNVILAGEACWSEQFSNPPSLSAGYQLGHALTRAFIDEKFNEEGVAQYLEWYDTYCYKPHGHQAIGGGSLVKYLTSEGLDYLAALAPEQTPPTAGFIRVFHPILETYQPLVPRIKEERPEILEKLRIMEQDMEKAQAERRKAGFPNK